MAAKHDLDFPCECVIRRWSFVVGRSPTRGVSRLSPCGNTSIHRQQRPCNPCCLVTRKEKNRGLDIPRLTIPAQWMESVKGQEYFSDLLPRQERTEHGSLDDGWRYGINPDAIF